MNDKRIDTCKVVRVKGSDLRVGMVLAYMGRHAKTITHFGERYTHPTIEKPARTAHSGNEWGMTVFDDSYVEVFDCKTEVAA